MLRIPPAMDDPVAKAQDPKPPSAPAASNSGPPPAGPTKAVAKPIDIDISPKEKRFMMKVGEVMIYPRALFTDWNKYFARWMLCLLIVKLIYPWIPQLLFELISMLDMPSVDIHPLDILSLFVINCNFTYVAKGDALYLTCPPWYWFDYVFFYIIPSYIIYRILVYCYCDLPIAYRPHWTAKKATVLSVCKLVQKGVNQPDARSDYSAVVDKKHDCNEWVACRYHVVAVPKMTPLRNQLLYWLERRSGYQLEWGRLHDNYKVVPAVARNLFGWLMIDDFARSESVYFYDNPDYELLEINSLTHPHQVIEVPNWWIDFRGKNFRNHGFPVSVEQISQIGQIHQLGGLEKEDRMRKLNMWSRNPNGVAYNRYNMFLSTAGEHDSMENARIFAMHVLEDYVERQNDMPSHFQLAPQP